MPSLTPSPSASNKNPVTVEYCEPATATFYNILAFLGHALQASGDYNFESGSITKSGWSTRNFPSSKNSNHSFINALFSLEMVSRNEKNNLETWRLTLIAWPKQDGTLHSVDSSLNSTYYISEANKARSATTLSFNFAGNGLVKVDFDTTKTCETTKINNCSNVNKPSYWYYANEHIGSISNDATPIKDFKVNDREAKCAGWGEWLGNTLIDYTAGQYFDLPSNIQYEGGAGISTASISHFYTADSKAKHTIEYITTCLVGANPGQDQDQQNKTVNALYFYDHVKFNVYINGSYEHTWNVTGLVMTNSDKVLTVVEDVYGDKISYEVQASDQVEIEIISVSNGGYLRNGFHSSLDIKQEASSHTSTGGGLVDYWDSMNNPFSGLNAYQSDNFIKAFLPVYNLTLNEAFNKGLVHIAGLTEVMRAVTDKVGGGKTEYYDVFEDVFYYYGFTEDGNEIDLTKCDAFSDLKESIFGNIVYRVGNLYVIRWGIMYEVGGSDIKARFARKRLLEEDADWYYLNAEKCTGKTNPIPSASIALSSTPTPTPSATSVLTSPTPTPTKAGMLPNMVQRVAVNPITLFAANAGPWTGNRPGFNCPGPTYGNGSWNWALTSSVGSFPYWQGPNMSLRCLSSKSAAVQVWTVTVTGWMGCQGPSYTATSTKMSDETTITFQVGAGEMGIEFNFVNV